MPLASAPHWIQRLLSFFAMLGFGHTGKRPNMRAVRITTDSQLLSEYVGIDERILSQMPPEEIRGCAYRVLEDLGDQINEHAGVIPEHRPAHIQEAQRAFDTRYAFFTQKGYVVHREDTFVNPFIDVT